MKTRFSPSLRTRVALGVALPIFLALAGLSGLHFWRARSLAQARLRASAGQLAWALSGSLRSAMTRHDQAMLAEAVQDIEVLPTISRVMLVDQEGVVRVDTETGDVGVKLPREGPGCVECHRLPPAERARSVILAGAGPILRAAAPIQNESECYVCHPATAKHLGVLIVDAPLAALEASLRQALSLDLAISVLATLAITGAVHALMHRLVVRRVEGFQRQLDDYAVRPEARLPEATGAGDELDRLARAFNRLADELQQREREAAERGQLRQRAIVEERERLARELHDGVAQLLGYVDAKAMATRLLLETNRLPDARRNLLQLEEASRRLFVDVREAILGLKMSGQIASGLAPALQEYVPRFSKMSGLPVSLELAPEVAALPLEAETEVQLLRIVQEALSNVRKHARATRADVCLTLEAGSLRLQVSDDGRGFEARPDSGDRRPQFGLQIMRERAEAVGGAFTVETAPGTGTRVTVAVPVRGEAEAADARPGGG